LNADTSGHSTIQVRDFFSLGLDGQHGATHGSPVIFARGNMMLCGIGALKGLVYTNKAIIFEENGAHSQIFADELSELLQDRHQRHVDMPLGHDVGGVEEEVNVDLLDRHVETADFEMIVVEKMLQECCDSFDRRYLIYRRMLQHLSTNEGEDDASR